MIVINPSLCDEIGTSLRESGWWAGKLLPEELARALFDEACRMHAAGDFTAAAIGAGHTKAVDRTIRGDETCWVEGETVIQQQFLQYMLATKNVFESHFPIALDNFAGHYSYYPAGTSYQKHMDNARQRNSRIFSAVNYLNPDWQPGDGGELVIYDSESGSGEIARIKPAFGITALFFSTDFPHEVLETARPRYSVTGWFHRQERPFA